jgi:uncharacterized paraquat-inducible protein A
MPEAYFASSPPLASIERPRCPRCQNRMMLARLVLGPAGSDLPTFECPRCEHLLRMLAEDPMKSAKAGWLHSALRPPT